MSLQQQKRTTRSSRHGRTDTARQLFASSSSSSRRGTKNDAIDLTVSSSDSTSSDASSSSSYSSSTSDSSVSILSQMENENDDKSSGEPSTSRRQLRSRRQRLSRQKKDVASSDSSSSGEDNDDNVKETEIPVARRSSRRPVTQTKKKNPVQIRRSADQQVQQAAATTPIASSRGRTRQPIQMFSKEVYPPGRRPASTTALVSPEPVNRTASASEPMSKPASATPTRATRQRKETYPQQGSPRAKPPPENATEDSPTKRKRTPTDRFSPPVEEEEESRASKKPKSTSSLLLDLHPQPELWMRRRAHVLARRRERTHHMKTTFAGGGTAGAQNSDAAPNTNTSHHQQFAARALSQLQTETNADNILQHVANLNEVLVQARDKKDEARKLHSWLLDQDADRTIVRVMNARSFIKEDDDDQAAMISCFGCMILQDLSHDPSSKLRIAQHSLETLLRVLKAYAEQPSVSLRAFSLWHHLLQGTPSFTKSVAQVFWGQINSNDCLESILSMAMKKYETQNIVLFEKACSVLNQLILHGSIDDRRIALEKGGLPLLSRAELLCNQNHNKKQERDETRQSIKVLVALFDRKEGNAE